MTRPGETLGRYRLLTEIASGGMGSIYLARDERMPGIDKLVALKRIHKHLAEDERFVTMFLDEARVASLVRHANVCSVEDFGVEDGTYFLTMEHLVGEHLGRVLRAHVQRVASGAPDARGPRFYAIVARLLADACEGLHAAHELSDARGEPLHLVHRDISPPNLFVGYDGVIRVLDFGVAKTAGRLAETTVGAVKGKLAYMAPEQLRRGPLDRRVDVWALGVVAWEILTGRRLFRRETELETMEQILTAPIPLASEVAPDLPAELDVVVQRALARDPAARYPSAREMGRDLTRYLAECGLPIGLAEVAEWMQELFPNGRAEKVALVERALTAARDEPAPDSPPPTRTAPTRGEPIRPRSSRPWVAFVAVAVAAGAAGAWAAHTGSRDETNGAIASGSAAPATGTPTTSRDDATPIASAEQSEVPRSGHAAPAEAIAVSADAGSPEPAPAVDGASRGRSKNRRVASREPAVEASGEGTVQVVTSSGWATVRLGARELGTTPLRASLPAGRQTLTLTTEDGRTRRVPVDVHAGQVARVVVDLGR